MDIPKPTDADKDYFRSLVPNDDRIEVKPMFGNIAGFVNGNMFMGLFGPHVGVRLDDADREELRAIDGTGDFGPAGRPMKEYVSLPEAWRTDPEASEPWIHKALAHTAAMPAKAKKPKKKK